MLTSLFPFSYLPPPSVQEQAASRPLILIAGFIHDVSEFLEEHPGGAKILKRMGGKDASKQFWKYHGDGVLKKYGPKLKIGDVAESAKL